jgi:hypothetical protein
MTATYNDMHLVLSKLEQDPGTFARLNLDGLTAGRLLRKEVRLALKAAEANGANVVWEEERGLIESVFLIRMAGTGAQLAGPLRTLVEMADEED